MKQNLETTTSALPERILYLCTCAALAAKGDLEHLETAYYFGRKGWWGFFIPGVICTVISLIVDNYIASTIVAAFAFSCFWGIHEVLQQEMRVLRGWFPENPNAMSTTNADAKNWETSSKKVPVTTI